MSKNYAILTFTCMKTKKFQNNLIIEIQFTSNRPRREWVAVKRVELNERSERNPSSKIQYVVHHDYPVRCYLNRTRDEPCYVGQPQISLDNPSCFTTTQSYAAGKKARMTDETPESIRISFTRQPSEISSTTGYRKCKCMATLSLKIKLGI